MKTCDCNQGRLPCTCKMSPKLGEAVRRFGGPSRLESFLNAEVRLKLGLPPIMESDEFNARPPAPFIELPDTGTVKELQARNLRLKMEINRLNEMLNDRDEMIDHYRNPKPLKWISAAVLVGLVFVAHHYGFM